MELLPADIQELLTDRADALGDFGRTARFLATTASTNDDAARLAAAGAHEGAWVLADEQSAGRGRRGRVWASPPGAGLYLSVVFRPGPAGSRGAATSLLTLMAGVAVATGVRAATGLTPALKWPNDVMIEAPTVGLIAQGARGPTPGPSTVSRWRKLAGILAEASATGGELQFIILGMGLNLTPAAYPPDVQARATSLEGELGRPVDRALVLVEILSALAEGRRQLLAGESTAILDRWRALAPSSQGRRVRWSVMASEAGAGDPPGGTGNVSAAGARAAAVRTGVTRGIDTDGALLVETSSGTERIIAGEVEWE